jgi:hypothetical protein
VSSQPPANIAHGKSASLHAVFEPQLPTESSELTTIISDLKTRPDAANFMGNHHKIEKSPFFDQKAPEIDSIHPVSASVTSSALTTIITALERAQRRPILWITTKNLKKPLIFNQKDRKSLISELFKWEIHVELLPTPSVAPTKHPCDMSSHLVMFLFLSFNCHFAAISLIFFSFRRFFAIV